MGSSWKKKSVTEPEEGMEFESHEEAYTFYKDYAKSAGFGTAKLSSRRSRASKEFIDAKFSCIRYGSKQHSHHALNPRASPKIGCPASIHVKRRPSGRAWYVHSFVPHHNHDLLPHQSHFFRSHRAAAAAPSPRAAAAVVSLADWIRPDDDSRALPLDSALLLRRLAADALFYALDFNRHHHLRGAFWCPPEAPEDFSRFGDAVSVDLSRVSAAAGNHLPAAIFLGVNHRLQPLLLGCALLADDSVYSFAWAMQAWLAAVAGSGPGSRSHPAVVITDRGYPAVKAAAAAVFPASRHCFALWHVTEDRLGIAGARRGGGDGFAAEFEKCAFGSWTEEEFERRWWELSERFGLGQAEWFRSLYEDRLHWAPVLARGVSFAGLSARSRSESFNSFFDKYIPRDASVSDLVDRYAAALEDRREAEARASFDAWHEAPELKSPSPFEKQTAAVYTHEVFRRFQAEVLGAAACHLKKESGEGATGGCETYAVKDFEDEQSYTVEWNEPGSEIRCLCRSFEYKGYLCRHAIVVLQMNGVFEIPPKYVLQRWTNAATSKHPILGRSLEDLQRRTRRYNDLCRRAIILAEEGSLSAESYGVALRAVKEALKQCTTLSASDENASRPSGSSVVENPSSYTAAAMASDPEPNVSSWAAPKRGGAGKEAAGEKGKGMSDKNSAASQSAVPAPAVMFQSVASSAQFQNVASTNPHDNR